MGCPKPTRIADWAAARLSQRQGEEVARHLRSCTTCRTTAARVGGVRQALREIAESEAPVAPVSQARIEAALRWSRTQPSLPAVRPVAHRWAWGFGFAVAAAALVAVGVSRLQRPAPSPVAPATLAVRPPAPPPAPAPRVEPTVEAVVTLISGEVKLDRDGKVGPLDPQIRLRGRDRLLTGSGARVGFQWAEGTGALLGSASVARLEAQAKGIAVERGQLTVRLAHRPADGAFGVTTPSHRVSFQGSWVIVAADLRGTTVEVLEGVAEVQAVDGDGSSTRVAAPERAFFPNGHGLAAGARPLSGREAAARRLANEVGLLAAWVPDQMAATTGLLRLDGGPGAQVVVDGLGFGSSPLMLRRPHGRHLVELSRPGYATVSRWMSVGLEPSELREVLHPEVARPAQVPPEPEEVRLVVESHRRQIRACYDHSLKRNPSLGGTVTLEIQIGGEGQVIATSAAGDDFDDQEVVECLRREAGSWSFERARNATVVYPLVFRTPNR